MKKIILNSIVAMAAVGLLIVAPGQTAAQQTAAGSHSPRSEQLEGVWNSSVTLTDCHGHTIAAFRAFNMFNAGGTVTDVDTSPPGMHGTGLGTWEYLGGRQYRSIFYFFNFNPDGTFKGFQTIHRQIVLSQFGESFTSAIVFDSYDTNGDLLVSGCGTESAVRLP